MAFKKGVPNPNAGRPKGSPNKTTTSVKAALMQAFEGIGGAESFTAWAKKNPDEFYKIWVRMLPQEVTGADGAPLVPDKPMSLFEAARTFCFVLNQATLKK